MARITIPDEATGVVIDYNMPDSPPTEPERVILRDPEASESWLLTPPFDPIVFDGNNNFTDRKGHSGGGLRHVNGVRMRYWARVNGWPDEAARLNFGWLPGAKPGGDGKNQETMAYFLYLPQEAQWVLRNGFGRQTPDRPKTVRRGGVPTDWFLVDIFWRVFDNVTGSVRASVQGVGDLVQNTHPTTISPQAFRHGIHVEIGFPQNEEQAAIGEFPWTGELGPIRLETYRES